MGVLGTGRPGCGERTSEKHRFRDGASAAKAVAELPHSKGERFDGYVGAELADGAYAQMRHWDCAGIDERNAGSGGDFWGVEEDQFVYEVGGQGGCVEVRACFEEDAEDVSAAEILEDSA